MDKSTNKAKSQAANNLNNRSKQQPNPTRIAAQHEATSSIRAMKEAKKQIVKPVLASPLSVPWPNIPNHIQKSILHALPSLLPRSIAEYHTSRTRCNIRAKRTRRKDSRSEAKATAKAQTKAQAAVEDVEGGLTSTAAPDGDPNRGEGGSREVVDATASGGEEGNRNGTGNINGSADADGVSVGLEMMEEGGGSEAHRKRAGDGNGNNGDGYDDAKHGVKRKRIPSLRDPGVSKKPKPSKLGASPTVVQSSVNKNAIASDHPSTERRTTNSPLSHDGTSLNRLGSQLEVHSKANTASIPVAPTQVPSHDETTECSKGDCPPLPSLPPGSPKVSRPEPTLVRPEPPEILSHLILGLNECLKSVESQIEDLKFRILLMSDALNVQARPAAEIGSRSRGALSSIMITEERGTRTGPGKAGQGDLIGRGIGGRDSAGRELLPTAPVYMGDEDGVGSGSESGPHMGGVDDGDEQMEIIPQTVGNDAIQENIDTDKVLVVPTNSTSNNRIPTPTGASIQSLTDFEADTNDVPPPRRNHNQNQTQSPIIYLLLPIPSINPPSLISPIPSYCATHNALIREYHTILTRFKARISPTQWEDVLGPPLPTALTSSVAMSSNGGGGDVNLGPQYGDESEMTGKEKLKENIYAYLREEIRIVPLPRVEEDLAALVGLRRLACFGIRQSHPNLSVLANLLPKSILPPPRFSLHTPLPIAITSSLLNVDLGRETSRSEQGTSNPKFKSSKSDPSFISAHDLQSANTKVDHDESRPTNQQLKPTLITYSPLFVKGLQTTIPVDGASRKAKRLEEVRAKRREAKMRRKAGLGVGKDHDKSLKKTNSKGKK